MPHKDPDKAKAYFKEYNKNRPNQYNISEEQRKKYKENAKRKYYLLSQEEKIYFKQINNLKSRLYKTSKKIRKISIYAGYSLKEKKEFGRIKYRYGLLPLEYLALVEAHNNVCAICNEPESIKNAKLSIDHCHETGKVRGLLCRNCNSALGKFKDSFDLVYKAAEYLAQQQIQEVLV